MRSTVKATVVLVLMFGTLLSYATEITKPIKVSGKKVKVEFNSVKIGQALTIKDENGITIYKQNIQETGDYSKIFDLTALKDGYYTTELEKDFEIIVKKIKVEKGSVTLFDNSTTKIFKPVIRNDENLLLISRVSFTKQPLKVSLYYKDELILSETLKGKELIERAYRLSQSEKGNYKVVISTDNRMYTEDFVI
ncbi:hypothetical protein DUT90_10925 [Polaribacter sp. WD7]|uniref:hypothetical protein n=1 Tax=Polaribacter sp. WD7 TaxID=2269061 RepID=UPI000DF43466|nr:hypothetical protein [Polaribacter sp. WD7]RCS26276.1 hypothetical protein DUT90_10925 [Polaribacter sp. WD7]